MATKSQQFKTSEERAHSRKDSPKPKAKRKARAKAAPTKTASTTRAHGGKRTAKKAAYALEHAEGGARPSRKSTRASAHRARTDSPLALRQEGRTRSPDARFARSRAKGSRVRGH